MVVTGERKRLTDECCELRAFLDALRVFLGKAPLYAKDESTHIRYYGTDYGASRDDYRDH